jgi:hypothetical protein
MPTSNRTAFIQAVLTRTFSSSDFWGNSLWMLFFKLHNKLGAFSLACVILSGLSLGSHAETIKIPLGQQGKALDIPTPKIHMSQSEVTRQYGEPMNKIGPVGTPPIHTWDYEQFSVYFEGEYVIHSVVKMQPHSN